MSLSTPHDKNNGPIEAEYVEGNGDGTKFHVEFTGAPVKLVVPTAGVWRIVAKGAQGGNGSKEVRVPRACSNTRVVRAPPRPQNTHTHPLHVSLAEAWWDVGGADP